MLLLIRAIIAVLTFLSQLIISIFLPLPVLKLLVKPSFQQLPSLQPKFWLVLKLQLQQRLALQLQF